MAVKNGGVYTDKCLILKWDNDESQEHMKLYTYKQLRKLDSAQAAGSSLGA